ncbi:MAG: hypothetical protein COB04_18440 [Gammaproteobacteria bacterium]|nr:MAG: hypothetical protein COB04_18440 [Gammaproteobacteria bacterium]
MLRTTIILDLLKDKLGSDYRTSLTFGKGANYIGSIRHRGGILTDEMGLKAADILGFPGEFIILSLAAERAIDDSTMFQLSALAERHQPEKKHQMNLPLAMAAN